LDLRLGYFTALTEDFDELLEESLKEGHEFLKRLKTEWNSGENQFDKEGETHVVAVEGSKAVGICGLNKDPYADDPKIGRVRHLYVHPEFRGLTIGSILLEEIIEEAKEHFKVLRLRTNDEGASAFYMKHGFKKSKLEYETHRLEF
jgi:ribosomal protein S18 acetylase RimI-like enzyme